MILEQFRLDGKRALVTGASAGLGQAIAVALAAAGADVAVHGNSRSPAATQTLIEKSGGKAVAIVDDLSAPDAPAQIFAETLEKLGGIDILINNAGTIRRAPAADFSLEDWNFVVQVNLTSVFSLSQLAGKHWLTNDRAGKIVNIASLLSFQGGITVPAYTAAKSGVAGLTKALANEWAKSKINVNAIAPGYFRTDNTTALQADETRNRQILERIPANRWGEPDDLTGAAIFLSSPASNYVHGHTLVVDGGWLGR